MSSAVHPLDHPDVAAVVRLLGALAGSTAPLTDRRRHLMSGLATLVGADVWLWAISRGMADGTPGPLWTADGGFADTAEQTQIWGLSARTDITVAMNEFVTGPHHQTYVYDPARLSPASRRLMEESLQRTPLSHLLFSVYPMGDGVASGIGLHRRKNRPPYTPREAKIVHLVISQIDWLHRAGTDVPANTPSIQHLSPRQREVLIYLLYGEGRKQIAQRMTLSEHTINDHVKALHKHFHVNSSGELLAKFVGTTAP
ncbi:MAG TPA: LuxR C-terminal-related transcriptional regulator [Tepidisphaeraceae bacterium]